MKTFLVGVIIVIIASIGLNVEKPNNSVSYQFENKVISYDELIKYTDKFKTGDIINLENTDYLISSYGIPGRWKHSIFYLGTYLQVTSLFSPDDKYYQEIIKHYQTKDEILVLDSNSSGVKIRTLDQMANLKKESCLKALAVYRFNQDNNFIKTYLNKGFDYLGTPYDYSMMTYDDKMLYCSELIYCALKANQIEINQTSKVVNHILITPSDVGKFLETLDNVEQIYLIEK